MPKEEIVTSLKQYVSVISRVVQKIEKPNLINENILFFRGLKDKSYKLEPTIARYPSKNTHNNLTWYEERFIHEANRKLPDIFTNEEYPINLLTKLRHYGIPARIMDITTNALVALYFACEPRKPERRSELEQNGQPKGGDGEVIVFQVDMNEVNSYSSSIVNAIAKSYKISKFLNSTLEQLIQQSETEEYFYGDSYKKNRSIGKEDYLKAMRRFFGEPRFIMPIELTERQKRQQGAFIIFPNIIGEKPPYYLENDIKPIDKKICKYIKQTVIIPAEHKESILYQLRSFGISKDFLFPDSIDVICETINNNIESLYR